MNACTFGCVHMIIDMLSYVLLTCFINLFNPIVPPHPPPFNYLSTLKNKIKNYMTYVEISYI